MSSRTFTVFRDTPTTTEVAPLPSNASSGTGPLSVKTLNSSQSITPSTNIEKENMHPLTGERVGTDNSSKKRKNSILAPKSLLPLSVKKQKEIQVASTTDVKKRRPSSTVSKVKKASTKDGKSSTKKGSKRLARKPSSLPKVVEEEEPRKSQRRSQAEIDSRCYELTVQPLADLSQAYEQGSSVEAFAAAEDKGEDKGEDKEKFRQVKASSVEPEIRDYFSSPPQSAALPLGHSTTPPLPDLEGQSFSTPERKKIYAAFTFSSPSASGKRFGIARASSLPRLDLV